MIEQAAVSLAMNCWPGVNATAGVQEDRAGRPVLAVYLDTATLVLHEPPFPAGDRSMARFCRELSSAASAMAARLDPEGEPVAAESTGPRHALASKYPRAGGGT